MKHLVSWLLLIFGLAVSSLFAEDPIVTFYSSQADPLPVPYRNVPIQIDGDGNDSIWKEVPALTHFVYYWDSEDVPKTQLQLFYNDTDLCFLYTVEDRDIVKAKMISEEMDIADEDRVEFGFSPESETSPYYFFEIDSEGRVLDYEARYYRNFDETWDSAGLEVAGRNTDSGYQVEGKFSLQELRDLNVLQDDGTMIAGFFRGEYFSVSSPNEEDHKWISWVYSQTEYPDFHVRSAFGTIRLESK